MLWERATGGFDDTSGNGQPGRKVLIVLHPTSMVLEVLDHLLERLLSKSKQKALKKVIKYFKNHRRWMKYDQYLAAGLPIATGVVESACGSLPKHRMEGSGKRWSTAGAEAILLLRSLKKSNNNDLRAYWRYR